MTLQEIIDAADVPYVAACEALAAMQAAYHAGHGRYYQLLPTPATVPVDGAVATLTVALPNDETDPDAIDQTVTLDAPFQGRIDVWQRGAEVGYTVRAVFETAEGDRYERQRTEMGADTGWQLLPAEAT